MTIILLILVLIYAVCVTVFYYKERRDAHNQMIAAAKAERKIDYVRIAIKKLQETAYLKDKEKNRFTSWEPVTKYLDA